MERQVLVTGCYRSGSTYLALLLSNHPELAVGLHTTNWPREQHEHWIAACEYAEKRQEIRANAQLAHDRARAITDGETPLTRAQHWDCAMHALHGSSCWAEKVQLEWRYIPTFLEEMGRDASRALVIVRDPRAILASFKRYTIAPEPAYLGAAFNALDCMQQARRLERRFARARWVRYEDIVENPYSFVGAVFQFLGLCPLTARELTDQSAWPAVPGVEWGTRSSFQDAGALDLAKAVSGWREHLSDDERWFVETVTQPELWRFGYGRAIQPTNPMPLKRMRKMCEGDDRVLEAFEHWAENGLGSCFFPLDPTDETTWQENQ